AHPHHHPARTTTPHTTTSNHLGRPPSPRSIPTHEPSSTHRQNRPHHPPTTQPRRHRPNHRRHRLPRLTHRPPPPHPPPHPPPPPPLPPAGKTPPAPTNPPTDPANPATKTTTTACDAADRDALAHTIATIPPEHPLTAIIHTAGTLDDATLTKLTPQQLHTVFTPKAQAALNLHELTTDHDLAAFILYSSTAGLTANPGHANYAPAHTLLDTLSHH